MGNVSTTARLMRPDGTIVNYGYPVQVAMLMILHPDYLVIRSAIGPVAPGQRRNVKVMDMDERLVLGQSYIMYPIPEQFKNIFNDPVQRIGGVGYGTDKKLTLAKGKKRFGPKEGWKKRSWWRVKSARNKAGVDGCFNLMSSDLEMQMEMEKFDVAVEPPIEIKQKAPTFGRQRTRRHSYSGQLRLQPVAEIEECALLYHSQ